MKKKSSTKKKYSTVLDFPIWPDHPWQSMLPEDIHVRRGSNEEWTDVAFLVVGDSCIRHIMFEKPDEMDNSNIRAALCNLGYPI